MTSRVAIPHLKDSPNAHILTLAPPLNLNPKWFKNHVAYTMSKYGMSMCTLGMAEELKRDGIAVNALWPRDGDCYRSDRDVAFRDRNGREPETRHHGRQPLMRS